MNVGIKPWGGPKPVGPGFAAPPQFGILQGPSSLPPRWGGPPPPRPMQGGGSVLSPGALVSRLWSQTPAQYMGMLPSQMDFLSSVTSALGYDPRDAMASKWASFPGGVNPAAGMASGF